MSSILEQLFSLRGKVALVTGASSGIGRDMAETLAAAGASVVLVARNEAVLRDVAAGIEGAGGRAAVLPADLAQRPQVFECARRAGGFFGDIDILVNSAGINLRPPVEQIDEQVWDQTMAINMDAPFFLSQQLAQSMRRRRWGRIIHIASQQSVRAFGNSGAYGVSKGGIASMTRGFAESWSAEGVTCNAIAPAYVNTPLAAPVFKDPQKSAWGASRTMIGRNSETSDLRGVIIFLASPASDYMTGQIVFVDGGFSAK